MDRRRFLFVLGGSTAGIVLTGHGLIALPHRMALLAGGQCSFCLGVSGVRSVAGMFGKPARMCDLCVTWLRSLGDDVRPLGNASIPKTSALPFRKALPDSAASRVADKIAAFLTQSTSGTVHPETAKHLRRLLGDSGSPLFRAQFEQGVADALARAPVDYRVRFLAGDLLARSGASEAAAAQYALVAAAYRHDGFYLKCVAMMKQIEKLSPLAPVRHELAELYDLLGLVGDAARTRRATGGELIAACSFCEIGREHGRSFAVLGERVCEPCLREAASLFEDHRAM